RMGRLAPPHPQAASPPRPELGMPPLRGHERSGADGLLVLWGGDRPPRRASLGRADRGNVAVPQMPRMEQRLPPILLVVRDHPSRFARSRMRSNKRSVAIQPGATAFTRIWSDPSSRARVFTRPTTAARIAFERTRLSTGCFTEIEVIATIEPPPRDRIEARDA